MTKDGDLLSGVRPPAAPAELRARVLEAAERALRQETVPSLWDRLYASMALRAVWAAIVLALLVANAAVAVRHRSADDAIARSVRHRPLRLALIDAAMRVGLDTSEVGRDPAKD